MLHDLRFGLRSLRRNPGFATIAVATLALGVGANTAIFSVVDAVVLHPIPLPRPDELVSVTNPRAPENVLTVSWPDYVDVREQASSFQALAAYRRDQFTLTHGGEPRVLQGTIATANLLTVLGSPPALGRDFAVGEDEPGHNHVVILSDRLWRRQFAQDAHVIGRSLTLDGEPYTVVGVAPPAFHFPPGAPDDELFTLLPHRFDEALRDQRGSSSLSVVGRLKTGITIEALQTELDTIQARLASSYPDTEAGRKMTGVRLEQAVMGDQRPKLFVLLGAVGFVLLIACANVSNLLLARATGRQREMATRAALGASRRRIVRQLLTESALLATLGGGIGLVGAAWSVDVLSALLPDGGGRMAEVSINLHVLLFTALISIATSLVFGFVPALFIARVEVAAVLRGSARTQTGSHARGAFLVAEVALAVLLCVGAGLTLQSFARLSQGDPGFDSHDVLTAKMTLPPERYPTDASVIQFVRELEDRLKSLPGASATALADTLPLGRESFPPIYTFTIEGRPETDDRSRITANARTVSPDYFKVMGIHLLRGRLLTAADEAWDANPAAIINANAARRGWPDEDAIGKHITVGMMTTRRTFEVVGVVADVKFASLAAPAEPELYTPATLLPGGVGMAAYTLFAAVRAPHATSLLQPLRDAVGAVDSALPVTDVETMDEYVSASLSGQRWTTLLLGILGALALFLAAIGVYGVSSYSVTQRTRELGIRMALGARRGQVLGLVLAQSLRLSMLGVAIGIGAALLLAPMLDRRLETAFRVPTAATVFGGARPTIQGLYEVSPRDPMTFLSVAGLLILVAMLATYLPARRATQVDPTVALQAE